MSKKKSEGDFQLIGGWSNSNFYPDQLLPFCSDLKRHQVEQKRKCRLDTGGFHHIA